jgi:hypothetical protein
MDHLTPDEKEAVNIAAIHHDQNQISLSTPDAMPLFCWSGRALKGPQVKEAVEAQGNSPYLMLAGWPMPQAMALQIPGRPPDLPHCWLCIVQVKADPKSFAGKR